jgi:UDP-glucose 4-epimerase
MTTSSVLITGGCGFIGTSLIANLLSEGADYNIRVLDNFVNGSADDLSSVTMYKLVTPESCSGPEVALIEGDIRDPDTALQCAQGVDCIVHLAANTGVAPSVENPRLDLDCNVVGTFNILEAARIQGVKQFIFASSGAPAGEVEPPIHEELPPHPVSPYGASKLAGEGYCSAYFRTFGIRTVCLRFGNVYGPGSKKKSSVVAKFIRHALAGETCVIYGDGSQTRDFLYIGDLIRSIQLCMAETIAGETFQIATGMERTVGEVADLISACLARRGIEMQVRYDAPRLGDVKRNFADTGKARRILGWKPAVPLEQGIEATIDYFINTAAGE